MYPSGCTPGGFALRIFRIISKIWPNCSPDPPPPGRKLSKAAISLGIGGGGADPPPEEPPPPAVPGGGGGGGDPLPDEPPPPACPAFLVSASIFFASLSI